MADPFDKEMFAAGLFVVLCGSTLKPCLPVSAPSDGISWYDSEDFRVMLQQGVQAVGQFHAQLVSLQHIDGAVKYINDLVSERMKDFKGFRDLLEHQRISALLMTEADPSEEDHLSASSVVLVPSLEHWSNKNILDFLPLNPSRSYKVNDIDRQVQGLVHHFSRTPTHVDYEEQQDSNVESG